MKLSLLAFVFAGSMALVAGWSKEGREKRLTQDLAHFGLTWDF
jgi:hypothetical protein